MKKNDEEIFSDLFREYSPVLYSMMVEKVGDSEFAYDIVQDTFLRVWKKRLWLEDAYGFFSLIKTIGYNICYDYFRRETTKKKYCDKLNEIQKERLYEYSPEKLCMQKFLEETIDHAIEKGLPKKMRRAFKMVTYEKKTVSEVAETFSLSKRTIENQLYSARIRLRKIRAIKEINGKQKQTEGK